MMKPYAAISVVLLAFIALGHLLRVLAGWQLLVGTVAVPVWPSILAFIVFGGLAIMLWRETRRDAIREILAATQQLKERE